MCSNCRDKPKFGGGGVKKQACQHRRCLQPTRTGGGQCAIGKNPQGAPEPDPDDASQPKAAARGAEVAYSSAAKPQGGALVGLRVRHYWGGSRKWFKGKVVGFDELSGAHTVRFDDTEVGSYMLDDEDAEKWELEVELNAGDAEAAQAAPPPSTGSQAARAAPQPSAGSQAARAAPQPSAGSQAAQAAPPPSAAASQLSCGRHASAAACASRTRHKACFEHVFEEELLVDGALLYSPVSSPPPPEQLVSPGDATFTDMFVLIKWPFVGGLHWVRGIILRRSKGKKRFQTIDGQEHVANFTVRFADGVADVALLPDKYTTDCSAPGCWSWCLLEDDV